MHGNNSASLFSSEIALGQQQQAAAAAAAQQQAPPGFCGCQILPGMAPPGGERTPGVRWCRGLPRRGAMPQGLAPWIFQTSPQRWWWRPREEAVGVGWGAVLGRVKGRGGPGPGPDCP
ncbi:hypothetical protein PVAP13_6NG210300 [Panicum virgatum]|uniref:Uncharacterized protein n=1 Tax=Panicum virgatum TaxID=38727 RepID=A0A8T0QXE2_PANVG|nr:hypothetical protein PVAP13_6NG210300 [Panicum virgatum]